MSALSIFNSGSSLPAYLNNIELDETTKNLAGNSGGGSKRISIKGGVYRMLVNGQEIAVNEERAMDVIIVASSTIGRTFYEGTYSEGEAPKAPVCWSSDGAKPTAEVSAPQAANCASCAQNIKGSGQGDGRACRYSQRLAVVLEGDISGDVYQLSLPATSIFGDGEAGQKLPMQAFARFLAQYKIPVGAVVTEMRFDTSVATPKLTFSAKRPLTEQEFQTCKSRGETEEAKRAVVMTVSQADGVKPTTPFTAPAVEAKPIASPKPNATPKPKAKPAEVVEDIEEVDEPVKVVKEVAPSASKEVTDLLDEWDV